MRHAGDDAVAPPVFLTTALRDRRRAAVDLGEDQAVGGLAHRTTAAALRLEQLDAGVGRVVGQLGDVQVAGGDVLGDVERLR